MDHALEERIGNPDLFTGRKEELDYFLKWIDSIKERKSQSTALLDQLKLHGREKNELFKAITRYLPDDFHFCEYVRVWRYDSSPEYSRRFNVDIFAQAAVPGEYSLIGEVKNRDTRKFSREEAVEFERKFAGVKKQEKIDRAVGFIFSRSGFTKEAEDYCKEKGIACSEDERWLGDFSL